MLFLILGLESDVATPVAGAEVPTPPDSEEDMDLSPDIGPDQDRDPSPWPEIADQELELEDSGTGRQNNAAEGVSTPAPIASSNSHYQIVLHFIKERLSSNFGECSPKLCSAPWDTT